MRTRLLLLAAAPLLLASSCRDITAPLDYDSNYTLTSIAGEPLPAEEFHSDFVRVVTVSETLRFRPDGTGNRISVEQVEEPVGTAPEEMRFDTPFHYVVENGRVQIAFDCPPNASCVAPPHMLGRLTSDGIRFDFVLGARVPQQYLKVERMICADC
jgi:hypothetical protein